MHSISACFVHTSFSSSIADAAAATDGTDAPPFSKGGSGNSALRFAPGRAAAAASASAILALASLMAACERMNRVTQQCTVDEMSLG